MPTLNHPRPPDSNVTPEPPALRHYYLEALSTHIYLALAALAILVATRLVTVRLSSSRRAPSWTLNDHLQEAKGRLGLETRKDSAASYDQLESAERPPWVRDQRGVRLSVGRKPPQAIWTAGLLPLGARAGHSLPTGQPRAMDGIGDAQGKDHSGSAPSASRGVSTSNPSFADSRHQQTTIPTGRHPKSFAEERRSSRSPRSSPNSSASRRQSGGSTDGARDQRPKGKGLMDGHGGWGGGVQNRGLSEEITGSPFGHVMTPFESSGDVITTDEDHTHHGHFSRPPLLPPLTPPALRSATFPFQDRRPSYAVSIPPELDTNFFHQPNPDYIGDSTSADVYCSSPQSATAAPRRRSYTRSVPIGIPVPTTTSASSSTETMTSGETFSPSSYPSTSPLLPPPPPGQEFPYEYQFVGGPGGPGIPLSVEEIDLHGEIISVMDDAGHGWKRHTRVYGGGVCLACAAAGSEGGFYGDKVPLEDRR